MNLYVRDEVGHTFLDNNASTLESYNIEDGDWIIVSIHPSGSVD